MFCNNGTFGVVRGLFKISVFMIFLFVFFEARADNSGKADKPSTGSIQIQNNPRFLQQFTALMTEKKSWGRNERKIDSRLLLGMKKRMKKSLATGFPQALLQQVDLPAQVDVIIKGEISDDLVSFIKSLGGRVVYTLPQMNSMHAIVPTEHLESIAARSEVKQVNQFLKPVTNKIDSSQGDVAHKANIARQRFGIGGSGVTVGVLSDSASAAQLASLKASGDLPASASVLPGQEGDGADEGLAMMEIVYDLAPGANLIFASAMGGEDQMAANILALKDAGCKVIVDDITYVNEPAFQDGAVSQAVNSVVQGGVMYFSSAANSGNLAHNTSGTWEGDFSKYNSITINADGTPYTYDTLSFSGTTNVNQIVKDTDRYFALQWSDPWGSSSNDYDMFLYDSTGNIVDFSMQTQDGMQTPFEYIPSFNSNTGSDIDYTGYYLLICKMSGEDDRYLRLDASRGRLKYGTQGSTFGHNAAANAFCVAAANATTAQGTGGVFNGTESAETFSSDGPRHLFYDASGNPYTPGNFLASGGHIIYKPDFTAADGVSCATDGFNPFYGTSAAAPHAAAIAALALSKKPDLTRAELVNFISTTVWDIEAAGYDVTAGHGIMNADAILSAIAQTATVSVSPAAVSFSGMVKGDFSSFKKALLVSNTGSAALNWSASVSVPWLTLSKTNNANLAAGASEPVILSVNSAAAAALAAGTYTGTVTLINNTSTQAPVVVSVTLTLTQPVATMAVSPAEAFVVSGTRKIVSSFAPLSQTYTIANTGTLAMDWRVASSADWLTLSSTMGTKLAPGASTPITAYINNAIAANLPVGTYNGTLSFTNATSAQAAIVRTVTLTVGKYSSSKTFTIHNDGVGKLNITKMGLENTAGAAMTASLSWTPPAPLTILPGSSQTITVTLDWDLAPYDGGRCRLLIESDDEDEHLTPVTIVIDSQNAAREWRLYQ